MWCTTSIAALAAVAALLPPGGALRSPSNFWLLRQQGVVSTEEDRLVAAYVSSLRAGDSVAAERSLNALLARPIAIEFEPPGNNDGGTVVELSDGLLAEELSASGPRLFLVPDSLQGEKGRALAHVEEVSYSDGGLGSRVWDASVGLSIWLCRNAHLVEGKEVLELGSGVGLSGICAALAGAAAVTLSDTQVAQAETEAETPSEAGGELEPELGGEALLANLVRNAEFNGVAATAVELDWSDCLAETFEPHATFPLVLGADLVHDEKYTPPDPDPNPNPNPHPDPNPKVLPTALPLTLGLALTLNLTLRYTLPGLAAAVVKHTAPGGVAYLMCAKGRPGVEALPAALQATYGGVVEREEMSVMNSFGACEVVLITYTPRG